MSSSARPTPLDFQQARQYIDGVIATQERRGYPVGVPEADIEKAVLECAKWTAKMRRLAIRVAESRDRAKWVETG